MNEEIDIVEPDVGCFFADPRTLPGKYVPAKKIMLKEALEYVRRVKREENRDVTFEEMQQFAIR